ncbi:MAG: SHOCT domain-containing protein [Chloroflexi bacterium]|nr:SHOCT domain-containing protein [Chloroflexota bacterium]
MGIVDSRLVLVFLSIVITVVVPVFGIALGVALGFRILRGQARQSERASPVEIVKARYARGEITKQEFESLRRDLTD